MRRRRRGRQRRASGCGSWAPLLFGQVALAAGLQGMVNATPGLNSYYFSATVERPNSQFVATFTQGTADISAGMLHVYHFSTSRVEISTFPLGLAGANATLPAVLLDGEPAASLTTDLRVVQGRLPVPSSDALEVVLTQVIADQLHLAIGTTVPIAALSADPGPLVRVVGIVVTRSTTTFPIDRRTFDPANSDQVRYYVQQNPLDYVLTSVEAIGAYTYDWSQAQSVEPFFDRSGPSANPLPPSENPPLWQAWWVGTADYSRMNAQDLKAVVSGAVPNPTMRLNQLLGGPSLAQQTGFVSAYTSSGFWQGSDYGDYTLGVIFSLILVWLLAAAGAGAIVLGLRPIVSRLVERQQPVIAALQDRGASRRQILGALATQALVQAGIALFVGGLLALLMDRLIGSAVVPMPAQSEVSVLVGSPFDSSFGIAGGIAAVLILLVTVLVLLRVMGRVMAPARTCETSATSG